MKKIRVLHVEHDPMYRSYVEGILEKENIKVDSVDLPSKIESLINENNYDVILTDVKWPENDTDEDEKKERLGEVINIVRKFDSLVPIVALSRKDDSHEIVLQYIDQIYDIWSKSAGYSQFLVYRLKNLIKYQQNTIVEKVLLEETIKLLKDNKSAWHREEVLKLCEELLKAQGLGFILKAVGDFFAEISYHVGISEKYIRSIFGAFKTLEPLDLARNEKSWGHLRHSVSVFLQGYVLLNEDSELVSIDDLLRNMGVDSLENLNQIWFISSAFHDTAVHYEHLPELFSVIKKTCLESRDKELILNLGENKSISLNDIKKSSLQYKEEDFNTIKTLLIDAEKKDLEKSMLAYMSSNLDHGIVSAAMLYETNRSHFSNQKILSKAAYIILMHNCFHGIRDSYKEQDDKLLQLFCIFDNFQAWGRENQYEGILNLNQFKKVVLRDFIRKNGDHRELKIKIDYIPFRTSSPGDPTHIENEKSLKIVLRKIIDILSSVGLKNETGQLFWNHIFINLIFCINGRELSVIAKGV
jgi:DNA-binding response OmpR family regulator